VPVKNAFFRLDSVVLFLILLFMCSTVGRFASSFLCFATSRMSGLLLLLLGL